MTVPASRLGTLTASTLLAFGVVIGGCSSPGSPPKAEYSNLLVNPNEVWDTSAYSAAPPVQNPNGQTGVQDVYTHRDKTRKITDTILVLSDNSAAATSLKQSQAGLGNRVVNPKTQPAPVGTEGIIVSGSSPDGSKSVSVLLFTEGKAATTVEFAGPTQDPITPDAVTEFGQQQDNAIKKGLPA
ncbi:MAG TPA: hypothetical protein VFA16_14295 [Mycobacterium sp.]|jgi:hypothetical protein|uniref:hypothetical protein n=1 Tax=Mycobacterium sp. TaxID=1785 RepID=UPI002D51FCBF|nr:hypothetical protein [Mycobacterium sp.]HZU48400.1 hypothetical protein [Mycobacterium sp.]